MTVEYLGSEPVQRDEKHEQMVAKLNRSRAQYMEAALTFPITGQDLENLLQFNYERVLHSKFWQAVTGDEYIGWGPFLEDPHARRVDEIIAFMVSVRAHTPERIQHKLEIFRDEWLQDKEPFHRRIFLGTATNEDYTQNVAWLEARAAESRARIVAAFAAHGTKIIPLDDDGNPLPGYEPEPEPSPYAKSQQ